MANLKCIIVGAGYMGTTHIQSYRAIPRVDVVGIVDANLKKLDEIYSTYAVPGFNSLELAIEKLRPDIVDVCLPSNLHKQSVLYALLKGCHVIVEKPFAVSLQDIDEMMDAASVSKGRLMVAHVCRFMPQYRFLKKVLENNELGKPVLFNCWRLSETPMWSWNNWLHNDKESGGTLMDLSIHDVDICNWLLGKPISPNAYIMKKSPASGCSHILSKLVYPGITTALVEGSHIMPKAYPFSTGYRLVCEEGVIEYNTVNCGNESAAVIRDDDIQHVDISADFPMLGNDPYTEELSHFVGSIAEDTPFIITPAEARLAVKTVWDLLNTVLK